MPIESDKPKKKCRYCNKEVSNLGYHIANVHPKILEQIDEVDEPQQQIPQQMTYSYQMSQPTPQKKDINQMIQEKLDIMLNIKIIEMLSKSPDMTVQDINKMVNPTPPTNQLQDLKAMHDMIFQSQQQASPVTSEGGTDWAALILNALPAIAQMLPQKRQEIQNVEYRTNEEGSTPILRPIQEEIARDRTESASTCQESGAIVQTEQQNNRSDATISKGS